MTEHRRRHWLIYRSFQLRFMAYMLVASLAGISLLYITNLLYFDAVQEMGADLGLHESHPYFSFIEAQRSLLLKAYLYLASIDFVLLMAFSFYLSYRIAGPSYKLERYIAAAAGGQEDLGPFHLRAGDFFPEIEFIANKAVDELRKARGLSND